MQGGFLSFQCVSVCDLRKSAVARLSARFPFALPLLISPFGTLFLYSCSPFTVLSCILAREGGWTIFRRSRCLPHYSLTAHRSLLGTQPHSLSYPLLVGCQNGRSSPSSNAVPLSISAADTCSDFSTKRRKLPMI